MVAKQGAQRLANLASQSQGGQEDFRFVKSVLRMVDEQVDLFDNAFVGAHKVKEASVNLFEHDAFSAAFLRFDS